MIGKLCFAMAAVLATWTLFGLVLVGLGLALQRLFGCRQVNSGRCLTAFWMGFALLILFLQIWNYVLPINWQALVVICVLGGAGLAWHASELMPWFHRAMGNRTGGVFAIILIALWIANQSIGPGNAHDSGMYHYGVIQWANAYPVVPGLGNLSTPYALNHASLLYAALLNVGPWHGRVEHVANGLLLLALLTQILISMGRMLRHASPRSLVDVFNIVLIVPVVMLLFSKEVNSPKTDLPQAMLVYVVASLLVGLLERSQAHTYDRGYRIVCITTLSTLIVCFKLIAIVFASFVLLLVAWHWITRQRALQTIRYRTMLWSLSLAGLLMTSWIGRNVIMSGYPLYPSTAMALPIQWRVPESMVTKLVEDTRNYGRGGLTLWVHRKTAESKLRWYAPLMKPPFETGADVKGLQWIRPWFFSLPISSAIEVVLPMLVVVASWIIILVQRIVRHQARGRMGQTVWLLMPCAAAMVCWLMVSPDPRYAYGPMWTAAAICMALAFRMLQPLPSQQAKVMIVALALLLTVPAIGYRAIQLKVLRNTNPLFQIPFRLPGSDHGFHRPEAEMQVEYDRVVRGDLTVYVPTVGTKCWRGPLVCTGWAPPDPDLRLRQPGSLASGFFINRHNRHQPTSIDTHVDPG